MRIIIAARFPAAFLFSLLSSVASAQVENVVWTDVVGATATGNSLSKTASTAWGNAGATSLQVLDFGGFVEFTATETNKYRMAGLGYGDSSQTYTDIEFAIYLLANGQVQVYESGTSKGAFGTYVTGDRFRVEATSTTVRYRKNGVVLYTSTIVPAYPLQVDTALYETGSTLTNVTIGTLSWRGDSGVKATGATLTKTGSAGWNAGAASAASLSTGDGYLEFTATEVNTDRVAGLNGADTSLDPNEIDFALWLHSDQTVSILEDGVSQGNMGSYVSGDRFRVEILDGEVRYLKNGSLLYTSATAPSHPLVVDSSFEDTGATLTDVVFSPVIWTSAVAVTTSGANLTKTGSAGWNAGAASSSGIESGDGYAEYTAARETNTDRALGLSSGDSGQTLADIDHALALTSSGQIEVFESGVSRGIFGAYVKGDRLRVEVGVFVVKFRKNGSLLYTSAVTPTYPLNVDTSLDDTGATLANVSTGDLVWTSSSGLRIVGNNLTKTASTAWGNAGAVTTKTVSSGSAFVEFTATETNTARMIGLSNGDVDTNYTDIDFALYLNQGVLYVYEGGTSRGSFGAYATGDRMRVEVESGVVKYRKNGTLIYTSGVTPQYPLLVDTSLYMTGATLRDIRFEGVATQQVAIPVLTPSGGTYYSNQSVTITCGTSGATIHYTSNGVDPTESDPVVTGAISVTSVTTLKAKAWKSGMTPSDVAQQTYTLTVPTPELSPASGTQVAPILVTVTSPMSGVTLRYSTDGFDPTETSPTVASGAQVSVAAATLKVKGWYPDWAPSATATGTYSLTVAQPTFSPPAGSYTAPQNVTVSTTTSGAAIRCTLDGSEPTASSPICSSPLVVDTNLTVKAKAYLVGLTPSSTATGAYTITQASVATPLFNPPPGAYATKRAVFITSTTAGATIRYTTNGRDPVESDLELPSGQSVLVDRSILLKAKAWKSGLATSPLRKGEYEITGAVAAGGYHTLVLKTNGTVWAFGLNSSGQLGTGSTSSNPVTTPVQVSGLTDIVAIAAGLAHSLAVRADGAVFGWGLNQNGQIGINSTVSPQPTPVQVKDQAGTGLLSGIVRVAAGDSHSLALTSAGSVLAWGDNAAGRLGDGTQTQRTLPVAVTSLTGVSLIGAGGASSYALKTDGGPSGAVWACGQNNVGQLGDGTTTARYTPVPVLPGASALAGGSNHALAVKVDGSLRAWGKNTYGALGDGTSNQSTLPVSVVGEGGVGTFQDGLLVAGGLDHTLMLKTDRTARASGGNVWGQLGDGTGGGGGAQQLTPVTVRDDANNVLTDIATVSAGLAHSGAVGRDGSVWMWGWNQYGQGGGAPLFRVFATRLAGFRTCENHDWNDPDHDGLTTTQEVALGTDPHDSDTNDDGVVDGAAIAAGLSATDLDMDDDGVLNAVELGQGSDPFRVDTDGDTHNDGADCFPVDPTRWQCPSPTQGDTTPPVITLTEPTNATLISSVP